MALWGASLPIPAFYTKTGKTRNKSGTFYIRNKPILGKDFADVVRENKSEEIIECALGD